MNGFNSQDGIGQTSVINETSGFTVTRGGLTESIFINVAGDLNSSGGGNPAGASSQGPRLEWNELTAESSKFNCSGFLAG